MQFFNGVTLEDIKNKTVDVFLRTDTGTITSAVLCQTFVHDGCLWIDFIPHLHHKYTAPLPDDAVISRNEAELSVGRFGIFVLPTSSAGQLLKSLIDAKQERQ